MAYNEDTSQMVTFRIDDKDDVYITSINENIENELFIKKDDTGIKGIDFVRKVVDPKFQRSYSRIKKDGIDSTHDRYMGVPHKKSNKGYESSPWEIIVDKTGPSYQSIKNTLKDAEYQVNVVNNPNSKENKIKNFRSAIAAIGLIAVMTTGMYALYDYEYNGKLGVVDYFKNKLSGKASVSSELNAKFQSSTDSLNQMLESSKTTGKGI